MNSISIYGLKSINFACVAFVHEYYRELIQKINVFVIWIISIDLYAPTRSLTLIRLENSFCFSCVSLATWTPQLYFVKLFCIALSYFHAQFIIRKLQDFFLLVLIYLFYFFSFDAAEIKINEHENIRTIWELP